MFVTVEDLEDYVDKIHGALVKEYTLRGYPRKYIPLVTWRDFSKKYYHIVILLPLYELHFAFIHKDTGDIYPHHLRRGLGKIDVHYVKTDRNIYEENPPLLLADIRSNRYVTS